MLGWAAVCAVVVMSLSLLVAFNLDGVNRYDRDATFPSFPSVIRVKCGIDFGSAGAAASVFVDDVVLDQCR